MSLNYNQEAVIRPLKQIGLAANLPCSKRLKAIMPICVGLTLHYLTSGRIDSRSSKSALSAVSSRIRPKWGYSRSITT